MRVFLGADHAGHAAQQHLVQQLAKEFDVVDLTPRVKKTDDYPDVAELFAKQRASEDFGILLCGSGQGICIAANKYKGIRAVMCTTVAMAKLARQHNHANVLCLPGEALNRALRLSIVHAFLDTEPDFAGRHIRRVRKLNRLL